MRKCRPEVYMMMQVESGVGGTGSVAASSLLLLLLLPAATRSQNDMIFTSDR